MSIEIEAPPDQVSEILAPEDKCRVGAATNFIDQHDKVYLASEVTESIENQKLTYSAR